MFFPHFKCYLQIMLLYRETYITTKDKLSKKPLGTDRSRKSEKSEILMPMLNNVTEELVLEVVRNRLELER
jgi:hypothetical protein